MPVLRLRAPISASISMTTRPSGLIRGVTPSITPTFSKVMELVWPVGGVVVPLIVGTRCPTWTKAGWLSSVMICGRCRTSTRWFSARARSRKLTFSLEADSTSPP